MHIENGYYISECTSNEKPYAYIDTNTLYLPFNIMENDADEGRYKFEEYRVMLPVTKNIDPDVLKEMIKAIPDVMEAINEMLVDIFGTSASVKKTEAYKATIDAVKGKIADDEDKTFGIACRGIFPTWEAGNYIVGDVTTDPNTGYPYECMTAHDSTVNTDWTIDVRTLWKPWHSRKKEYALPWEQPTGAHDMYKTGEYMIWTDGTIRHCLENTNFSPDEYPQAWEDAS